MKRSLKFSLALANTNKLESLDKLSQEYRRAVDYFLKRLFQKKELSEDFLKLRALNNYETLSSRA